jgi:hypothetical protein
MMLVTGRSGHLNAKMAFEGLEPCEVKISRRVLRGLGAGNSPRLPGLFITDTILQKLCFLTLSVLLHLLFNLFLYINHVVAKLFKIVVNFVKIIAINKIMR